MAEPVRFLISFGYSRSANFAEAVKLATSFPGCMTSGEGKAARYTLDASAVLGSPEEAALLELGRLVCGWKSARFESPGRRSIGNGLVYGLDEVRRCHERRLRSERGDAYCSGSDYGDEKAFFGCRRLTAVVREARPSMAHAAWFKVGRLDASGTFHVDREQVLANLRATHAADVTPCCPAFSWERVAEEVRTLPHVLQTGADSDFIALYATDESRTPVGVAKRPREVERRWNSEMPLSPTSVSGRLLEQIRVDVMAKVLAEALAAGGMPESTIKVATAPPFPPPPHAVIDGRCTACGKTQDRLDEPCGRPDLGRVGMLELE